MTHVINIKQLQDRVDAYDKSHVDHATEVSHIHGHEGAEGIDNRPLKHLPGAPGTPGTFCPVEACQAIQFRVTDQTTGVDKIVCRECLNATRRLSLQHSHMINGLCFRCTLNYDRYGIIVSATHRTENPLSDFWDPRDNEAKAKSEGRERLIMKGTLFRIEQGLVEIDDVDPSWVLFHHRVHDAGQHCVGCRHVRHPGCGGTGLCTGCLPTPYKAGDSGFIAECMF